MTLGHPVIHFIHPRQRWTLATPVQHCQHGCIVARYDGFHSAVGAITHPAADAESAGFAAHGITKPHPLHTAVDVQMERPHFTFMPGIAPESGDKI